MSNRRVLVLESDLLLGAGIRSLLSGQEQLDVSSVDETNCEKLTQTIREFRPDVIVLAEDRLALHRKLLTSCLQISPNLRTIVVNRNDNQVQIWDKRVIVVHELRDFLDVL